MAYDKNYRMKKQRNKRMFPRRRICRFCTDASKEIDYKEPKNLRYFITERGRIIPKRVSGMCAKHQRKITLAIKRARMIALLPYVGNLN